MIYCFWNWLIRAHRIWLRFKEYQLSIELLLIRSNHNFQWILKVIKLYCKLFMLIWHFRDLSVNNFVFLLHFIRFLSYFSMLHCNLFNPACQYGDILLLLFNNLLEGFGSKLRNIFQINNTCVTTPRGDLPINNTFSLWNCKYILFLFLFVKNFIKHFKRMFTLLNIKLINWFQLYYKLKWMHLILIF